MSELKVLIVDDQPDVVESIACCVKQWGHQIETAYSGKQALEKAEIFQPHIILLDIMMPDMDGYAVAQKLRERVSRSETTVIGITALQSDEHRYRSYDSGFDLYLVKPFSPEKLKKILEGFERTIGMGISALIRKASRKSEKIA